MCNVSANLQLARARDNRAQDAHHEILWSTWAKWP
jgi:hypothetical protein